MSKYPSSVTPASHELDNYGDTPATTTSSSSQRFIEEDSSSQNKSSCCSWFTGWRIFKMFMWIFSVTAVCIMGWIGVALIRRGEVYVGAWAIRVHPALAEAGGIHDYSGEGNMQSLSASSSSRNMQDIRKVADTGRNNEEVTPEYKFGDFGDKFLSGKKVAL